MEDESISIVVAKSRIVENDEQSEDELESDSNTHESQDNEERKEPEKYFEIPLNVSPKESDVSNNTPPVQKKLLKRSEHKSKQRPGELKQGSIIEENGPNWCSRHCLIY